MERSFKQEVEKLKLGEGETFHGEAILAVTKALLQSGVAYVGGYQGAPVSHVMDVLNDAATSSTSSACTSRRTPTRRERRRCSAPRSTTRCAAPSPTNPPSAPMSPRMRCPI